jgi:hypothetical protein
MAGYLADRGRVWKGLALAAGLGLTGCANLSVQKVPVHKLQVGGDGHIKGFRYYVSRPYLVVPDKLVIAVAYEDAFLAQTISTVENDSLPRPTQVLVSMGADKKLKYMDLQGNQLILDEMEISQLQPIYAKTTAQKGGADSNEVKVPGEGAGGQAQVGQPSGGVLSVPANPQSPLDKGKEEAEEAKKKTAEGDDGEQPAPPAKPKDDPFTLVHLPDFEEQMAVKPVNILGTSKFKMLFRDGWQLTTVNGEHDSTPVTLELIETLKSLISSAGDVEEARLNGKIPTPPAAEKKEGDVTKSKLDGADAAANFKKVIVCRRHYIEPGMYRVKKSSEMGPTSSQGMELISCMGIPVQIETQVFLKND